MTQGDCNWDGKAHPEALIEPGWSVRLWVGLSHATAHQDLEKLRDRRQLGKIVIPMKIANESGSAEYRV